MGEQEMARAARLRIKSAAEHLERALASIEGPRYDWPACEAHIDMAGDVLLGVQGPEEVHGMTLTSDGGILFGTVGYKDVRTAVRDGFASTEGGADAPA